MEPCLPGDGWTLAWPWEVGNEFLPLLCLRAWLLLYLLTALSQPISFLFFTPWILLPILPGSCTLTDLRSCTWNFTFRWCRWTPDHQECEWEKKTKPKPLGSPFLGTICALFAALNMDPISNHLKWRSTGKMFFLIRRSQDQIFRLNSSNLCSRQRLLNINMTDRSQAIQWHFYDRVALCSDICL